MTAESLAPPDWIWEKDNLVEVLAELGFADSTRAQLLSVLEIFSPDASLRGAVAKVHTRLFCADEKTTYDISDIRRELADQPREVNGLLEALALLAEFPRTRKLNLSREIPDAVTHDTLRDLERWMLVFERQHGHPGFDKPLWIRRHFQGNLFSLGRLQFEPGFAGLPYRVYKHRQGGRLVALAEDAVWCDEQDHPELNAGQWQTRFTESETHFSGHAVNTFRGSLRPYAVEFSKADWSLKLVPNDPVLHVYIPAGDPLASKACEDSIVRAWDFFDRHFPETSFRGMMCRSWLLDPRLPGLRIINPNSQIAQFAARFHCLPVPGATDSQFLERIFSLSSKPTSPLPRDNSLRRAIAPHLEKGGTLHLAGGILLRPSDADRAERVRRQRASFQAAIPMPIQVVVDDLGWWCGRDGSLENEPFRTGISRAHQYEDYAAAIRLGKELGIRPMFAMILGEWDTRGRVESLFPMPWVAPHFARLKEARLPYERVASLLRESVDSIEIGLHGIMHEYWQDGKLSRSEWHDTGGHPRPPEHWGQLLELYWTLLDEYDFGQLPRSFVPPANRHHFCRDGRNFAATLAKYGISTIYAEIEKFVRSREPSHRWFGFDGPTMTIERSHDPFTWYVLNPEPTGIPPVPVCAMHWPNLLHTNPERNFEVVDRWVAVLRRENLKLGRMLSRNTEEFSEQLAHHETSRLEVKGRTLSVDASAFFQFPWMNPKTKTTVRVRVESNTPLRMSMPDPRLVLTTIRESDRLNLYELAIELTRENSAAKFSL